MSMNFSVSEKRQSALRCITATLYDKARTERNRNNLRGAELFTQYHHMCVFGTIINMSFLNIMVTVNTGYLQQPHAESLHCTGMHLFTKKSCAVA